MESSVIYANELDDIFWSTELTEFMKRKMVGAVNRTMQLWKPF